MATVIGSGTGQLTDDDGDRLPFEMEVTVEAHSDGSYKVLAVKISATDAVSEVTPEVCSEAALTIPDLAEFFARKAISSLTHEPDSVVEASLTQVVRRYAPLDDALLEALAEAYVQAQKSGLPAREAVMSKLDIGRSRAGFLISVARQRGLIPPAVVGRPKSSRDKSERKVRNASTKEQT